MSRLFGGKSLAYFREFRRFFSVILVYHKQDRSGAYAARYIARDIVRQQYADRCEVQLAYAIGVAEPVSVYVDCFGTNRIPEADIVDYILKEYDLTPRGIITALGLLDVDYNKVSSYGHFGKAGLPWEE